MNAAKHFDEDDYDLDGDGIITAEEVQRAKDIRNNEAANRKLTAQRRMATAVLCFMALYTLLLFLPVFPDSRIQLLKDVSSLLYLTGGAIVGGYFGISSIQKK